MAVSNLRADFHHLPLADAAYHATVAIFCLYHSPHPDRVISEIARCLIPDGVAVLVTKSSDSYHELDERHPHHDPRPASPLTSSTPRITTPLIGSINSPVGHGLPSTLGEA